MLGTSATSRHLARFPRGVFFSEMFEWGPRGSKCLFGVGEGNQEVRTAGRTCETIRHQLQSTYVPRAALALFPGHKSRFNWAVNCPSSAVVIPEHPPFLPERQVRGESGRTAQTKTPRSTHPPYNSQPAIASSPLAQKHSTRSSGRASTTHPKAETVILSPPATYTLL